MSDSDKELRILVLLKECNFDSTQKPPTLQPWQEVSVAKSFKASVVA